MEIIDKAKLELYSIEKLLNIFGEINYYLDGISLLIKLEKDQETRKKLVMAYNDLDNYYYLVESIFFEKCNYKPTYRHRIQRTN